MNKEKIKENSAKALFFVCAALSVVAVLGIVGYILYASVPAFRDIGVFRFLFGTLWNHSLEGVEDWDVTQIYGILPMIVNSLIVTVLSVLIGGTVGVFTAMFLVFWCPKKLRTPFDQVVKLLAGIPSVIYGYFGLSIVVPLVANLNPAGTGGMGILACSLVLAVMILPTVVSLSKNALEAVPQSYAEGALALGNTKAQSAFQVVLPAAKSGVISSIILAMGRSVGETMAVNMISGGRALFPKSLFSYIRTLTTNIVIEMADSSPGSTLRSALFATGFVLLVFVLLINLSVGLIPKDFKGKRGIRTLKYEAGHPIEFRRKGKVPEALKILSAVFAGLVACTLAAIIIFILVQGVPHLSWDFLFGASSYKTPTLAPAFISTIFVVLITLVIALPLGIGAAVFLTEYSKPGSRVAKVLTTFIDTLSGVPSVVFGLFGMLFFNTICGGYSILSGSLTMVLVVLPTVIRSTEESLKAVPDSLREASYGLGAGKVRTIFRIVLPNAFAGIATATVLAIGRIVGESAALVYTAGMCISTIGQAFNPMNMGSTLTVFLYMCWAEPIAARPEEGIAGLGLNEAYATAVVLLLITAILNGIVFLIERQVRKKEKR